VDKLLRGNGSAIEKPDVSERAEVARTFAYSLHQRALPGADKTYLGQLVSSRTGLNSSDAEKRVADVFGEAQDSADRLRKTIVSGAFCASYAGTIGGKQRDHLPV
jgi:hypothetical protein